MLCIHKFCLRIRVNKIHSGTKVAKRGRGLSGAGSTKNKVNYCSLYPFWIHLTMIVVPVCGLCGAKIVNGERNGWMELCATAAHGFLAAMKF